MNWQDFKLLDCWEAMNGTYLTDIIALGTSPTLGFTRWYRHARGKLVRLLTLLSKEPEDLKPQKFGPPFEEENKVFLRNGAEFCVPLESGFFFFE